MLRLREAAGMGMPRMLWVVMQACPRCVRACGGMVQAAQTLSAEGEEDGEGEETEVEEQQQQHEEEEGSGNVRLGWGQRSLHSR